MASAREMRLRIRSVKNLAQVTRALETVSASKVRKAMAINAGTKPYSEKAWKVMVHLARQPGHKTLHPLLTERAEVKNILVIFITSDSGLSGALNMNLMRQTQQYFKNSAAPVTFVTVGRIGRDMLIRRQKKVLAEFNMLPISPSFADISAIGHLVVEEYLENRADQVYIAYTEFRNMIRQEATIRKLLPLEVEYREDDVKDFNVTHHKTSSVFIYEPGPEELLDQIVPRFTSLQVYQAVLSSSASEHAARMVAMRNATDNANELVNILQLEYNKARQQSITNDMLDIAGGAEALAKSMVKNS
jgi:F-type H+-transporting ATPase subunit gamma